MPHTPQYRVEIRTPKGVLVDEKGLSEAQARAACDRVLEEYPTDKTLQEQLGACMRSLGFMGFGGKGYSITISAGLPRTPTGEKLSCPLRAGYGIAEPGVFPDEWMLVGHDRVCSYCGSLHPETLADILRSQGPGVIEQGKPGKWWVRRAEVPNASFGGLKFFHEHSTPALAAAWAAVSPQ